MNTEKSIDEINSIVEFVLQSAKLQFANELRKMDRDLVLHAKQSFNNNVDAALTNINSDMKNYQHIEIIKKYSYFIKEIQSKQDKSRSLVGQQIRVDCTGAPVYPNFQEIDAISKELGVRVKYTISKYRETPDDPEWTIYHFTFA